MIICVPTPLGKHHDPDRRYATGTQDATLLYLRRGQVISLESTAYPDATEEEVIKRVGSRALVPGKVVFVVYSSEREDPASPDFDTSSIPKVVGGHTPDCLSVGLALYGGVIDQVVPVHHPRRRDGQADVELLPHRQDWAGE